ncbi:hypothetical protein STEG23_026922 [Scotinomys teguina]
MEMKAAAPRCQLLLISLMSAVIHGTNGSLLLVQRTATRTIMLQETIGKDHSTRLFLQKRSYGRDLSGDKPEGSITQGIKEKVGNTKQLTNDGPVAGEVMSAQASDVTIHINHICQHLHHKHPNL